MKTKIYPSTMSLFKSSFASKAEYQKAYQDCNKHYGFKTLVEDGWKFFEFENDFHTWKNQK